MIARTWRGATTTFAEGSEHAEAGHGNPVNPEAIAVSTSAARLPPPTAPLLAAFAALYVFWGGTFLAIRYAVDEIPPLLMMATRCAGGAAILFAWLAWRRKLERPTRDQWLTSAMAGAFLFVGCHGLMAWAEQRVTSGKEITFGVGPNSNDGSPRILIEWRMINDQSIRCSSDMEALGRTDLQARRSRPRWFSRPEARCRGLKLEALTASVLPKLRLAYRPSPSLMAARTKARMSAFTVSGRSAHAETT
jgi:hypothetical protein